MAVRASTSVLNSGASCPDARTVIAQLKRWLDHLTTVHPNSPLGYRSPREFIKFTPTKFEFHANALGTDNLDYADPPIGVWVHHVIVKNGPLLIYYRNGVVVRTQPQTLELNNPQPLFMGGDNEKAEGEMFKGYLDNARIYNEALSGRAVLDLYLSEGPANVTPAEWESQP